MLITDNTKITHFKDISKGDMFKTSSGLFYYMKLNSINIKNGDSEYKINCINLFDGSLFYMNEDREVRQYSGNITLVPEISDNENIIRIRDINSGEAFKTQRKIPGTGSNTIYIKINETYEGDLKYNLINLNSGNLLYIREDIEIIKISKVIVTSLN